MIVVPALAHGEKRQEPVVARIVARHVSFAPAHVGQRIDAEGRMIDQHGAPEKTDDQS